MSGSAGIPAPSGRGGRQSADITVWCEDCAEPFRWIGVQAGLMPDRPMCSVGETELHAPLRPSRGRRTRSGPLTPL
jgi:hypothetical protein